VNEREEVPERCPFKRSRDAYREIESMKMRKNVNSRRKEEEWKDVSSGKVSSVHTKYLI
jgi:seryl-tRNA synthetase